MSRDFSEKKSKKMVDKHGEISYNKIIVSWSGQNEKGQCFIMAKDPAPFS